MLYLCFYCSVPFHLFAFLMLLPFCCSHVYYRLWMDTISFTNGPVSKNTWSGAISNKPANSWWTICKIFEQSRVGELKSSLMGRADPHPLVRVYWEMDQVGGRPTDNLRQPTAQIPRPCPNMGYEPYLRVRVSRQIPIYNPDVHVPKMLPKASSLGVLLWPRTMP
jgi:hypothetical protein